MPVIGGAIVIILLGTLLFMFTTVSMPLRYPRASEALDICGTAPRGISLITSDIVQEYEIIEYKLRRGEPPYVTSLPEPLCTTSLEKREGLKGTIWANYTQSCNFISECCNPVSPLNTPSAREFLDVIVGCYYSGGQYSLHPFIHTFTELRHGYDSIITVSSEQLNRTIRHTVYITKSGCLYICR